MKIIETRNFFCTMVLLNSNGEILITNTGEIKGTITKSTKGLNGFGYDPIFFIENLNKTMAQLSKEEKNTVSHRAKALIPILEYIKNNIL
ncbi:MAG: non-canonical purine NTP pyrophosphatase [Candidatus Melainabacteria bacterium]|nr:MAG: non-canonical purine NTP pyrophosphatase [Candidatus Melainabacteria bacterium]